MYIVRATQQIRSCMVMAAHVIREKRQVNAPRTVRKLALALNRLRLFLHPPRFPWKFLVRIHVPPGPPNHFHTCFQIWPL